MKDTCMGRRRWAVLLCLFAASSACSVDEWRHPQRMDAGACLANNGKPILDTFCVFDAATADSGHPVADSGIQHTGVDAGMSERDAGSDAGNTQPDAGPPAEPCTREGASENCYTGADINDSQQLPCRAGLHKCEKGFWGACIGDVTPTADTCNGVDDDCDGKTDEGLSGKCVVDDPAVKGMCKEGISVCSKGTVDCVRYVMPDVETCNDVDDDCDGKVDEDTALKCYPTGQSGCTSDSKGGFTCVGACSNGSQACVNGKRATTCTGSVTPQPTESCTNNGADAVDENCNDMIDEGCFCMNGETAKCYTGTPADSAGVGACKKGNRLCTAGSLGACMGDVTPHAESCANEGTDDDCNGVVDDVAIRGTSCADTSTAQGVCKTHATWQCSGGDKVCMDGSAGTMEICDAAGEDENCDGHVNEGFDLQTDSNNCGTCGMQCSSGSKCCAGHCVNTTSSNANCGQCGHACASGSACCGTTPTCKDVKGDNNNCGSCGNVCIVLTGCNNGSCKLLN